MTTLREQIARVIGSYPMHDDDRGPDNAVLVDLLPYGHEEELVYRLTDAVIALLPSLPTEEEDLTRMAKALNYVADMTYCGADAWWHFKADYDPQIVLAALSSAPVSERGLP